jgi:putative nucleotidyltransferase with HDIG domain
MSETTETWYRNGLACQHESMTADDARSLAERLLATDLPRRWQHVQAVAAEANRLCQAVGVDERVVVSAAWLHDIGYARTVAETGFHPLDGSRYLRARRWDDDVCRLVAHHTDAASQAPHPELGDQLRAEFPEIDGLAQDVLWAADATTGPTGQRVTLDERLTELGTRYGPDHPITRGMMASRTLLEAAIARVAATPTKVAGNG